MNYVRLKLIAVPLAGLSICGWIASDAMAVFGCFQRQMNTAASLYAGTGPCGGQRVVNYIPQTCYRVQYVQQAVTTYRPVCGTDPCTGCPVTTMKPVVCYRPAAQLVPYTTYRLVYSALQPACPTVATTYYAPAATCPSTCATGACGVTTSYAAPVAGAAPAAGCSSCGTAAPTTYSSGYVPSTSGYAPGTTTYAPGYSSGVRLGAPLATGSVTSGSPITTYAPGSTAVGATMPGTTVVNGAAPGGSTTVYSYGSGYSGPTSAATIESQTAPVIVRSAPGEATIVGPSASPYSSGPSSSGPYSSGPSSSGTSSSGTPYAGGTPYSSGTATFAPSLTTTSGSPAPAAAGDGMTPIPSSTFMFPPMRGGPTPAPAPAPAPTAAPSATGGATGASSGAGASMPVMPTPLPSVTPSSTAPFLPTTPIQDPDRVPSGPTLGRPAATTPLLIDPKDQTAYAWPARRAWGYSPIPGRSIPVLAASHTPIDEPTPATSHVAPPVPAAAAPVRLEAPVSAGDGWTRSGSGGGWQAVGR